MVYDLIVLGGGPAGYLGAARAGREGLQTLLVEKKYIGGVCLNEGCIPSKTLLYSAKIYDSIRLAEKYGVSARDFSFNHQVVLERKNKVVKTLTAGVRSQLQKNNVAIIEGFGEIAPNNAANYQIKVANDFFQTKRVLIATGSAPIFPEIPGLSDGIAKGHILTNREIFDLQTVPPSLIIIGGGAVGLEMASYFNSAGSNVTVIEMLDHIAGNTDREISAILLKNYQKRGVDFKLNSRIIEFGQDSVVYETDGQKNRISGDKILLSIGRRPVIDGIGLEKIGIRLEQGRIVVDQNCRTNLPGIYAAGDVNGLSMLAHSAYREAEVCINNIMGGNDIMRYDAIPSIIYTNPEVASVGETEESARQKGLDFETAKISMRFSGRYLAENEGGDGICKIIVDKQSRRLIGTHLIGNNSSEVIYGAGMMIENEMKVNEIKKIVFPHPTVAEIIREAIFEL